MTTLELLGRALEFNRSAIEAGESWRLLSGTFVHLSTAHLAGNATVLGLLVALCSREFGMQSTLCAFTVSALATSFGLLGSSDLAWYAGASGALWGVAGWFAARMPARYGLWWILAAALIVASDHRSLAWTGDALAPEAHLWGFVGGCLWGCAERVRSWLGPGVVVASTSGAADA